MEKLLAIASLGQRVYGRWLFQRLLSGIIVAAGLTIVTSVIISAFLVGGLWAAYFVLLHYGIGQLMAMMITGAIALMVIASLFFLTLSCLHHLRRMPRMLLKQSPLTSRAMDALDAFSDGLMTD